VSLRAVREPSDLVDAAQSLKAAREALTGFESTALSAVAESLARTAESLERVTSRLEERQPEEWFTPERAARYLGMTSVGAWERIVAKEGVPKHYVSDRVPRYCRRELDAWVLSR